MMLDMFCFMYIYHIFLLIISFIDFYTTEELYENIITNVIYVTLKANNFKWHITYMWG